MPVKSPNVSVNSYSKATKISENSLSLHDGGSCRFRIVACLINIFSYDQVWNDLLLFMVTRELFLSYQQVAILHLCD